MRYAEDPEYREKLLADMRDRWKEKMSDPELRELERKKSRASNWRHKYNIPGMTMEKYERMLLRQGGVCKICRKEKPNETLNVDHRHSSGWVRGLLCRGCNTGLGGYEDDVFLLIRAAIYVIISLIAENVSRLFVRLRRFCRRASDSEQFRSGPGT
jgi:hypothetical protein